MKAVSKPTALITSWYAKVCFGPSRKTPVLSEMLVCKMDLSDFCCRRMLAEITGWLFWPITFPLIKCCADEVKASKIRRTESRFRFKG